MRLIALAFAAVLIGAPATASAQAVKAPPAPAAALEAFREVCVMSVDGLTPVNSLLPGRGYSRWEQPAPALLESMPEGETRSVPARDGAVFIRPEFRVEPPADAGCAVLLQGDSGTVIADAKAMLLEGGYAVDVEAGSEGGRFLALKRRPAAGVELGAVVVEVREGGLNQVMLALVRARQ